MKGAEANWKKGQRVHVEGRKPIRVGGVPTYFQPATVTAVSGGMVFVQFDSGKKASVSPRKITPIQATTTQSSRPNQSNGATIHSGWLLAK